MHVYLPTRTANTDTMVTQGFPFLLINYYHLFLIPQPRGGMGQCGRFWMEMILKHTYIHTVD